MPRSCKETFPYEFAFVICFELFQDEGKFHRAEVGIYFRNLSLQVVAVTFTQAAGDVHFVNAASPLQFNLVKNGVDAFFLGLIDEPAGVNHYNIVIKLPAFMHDIDIMQRQRAPQHRDREGPARAT